MAESTSPSIFRAPHRLEYASSINTTLTSPTDISTYHSSFDFISEPRDCDTLVTMNQDADRTHRSVLERNFHQLDINTNANQMKRKPKKLDRTESISLPTTPTEELCSSYEHKYNQLLTLNTKINSDDEQPYFLNSSTDYMTAMPEHDLQQIITDEPILNSTSISQSTNSTLLPNSSETNISITYGIDWSERACPTSHCWFSYKLNDLSSSQPCALVSCKDSKSNNPSEFVQCESCLLIVHTHHLIDSSIIISKIIPACRPSFSESITANEMINQNKFDRHYWLHIPVLTKPCVLCKRKSMSSSLFGSGRPSTMPSLDAMTKSPTYKSPLPDSTSPKLCGTSNGFQCLWCSRSYHRRCWDQITRHDEYNKCDYGVLRNIIVRPQWLRRIPGPSPHFRAQYRFHTANDSTTVVDNYTPLLLFINKRSGGQSGEKIYRKLLHLLNPRQVFLLENDATILHALEIYSSLSNIRICVFGGDGTVGWILGCLAELYPPLNNPPVSICPLGTGNDLSRILLWGEQYDPKRLLSILTQIPRAQSIALDRWQVSIEQVNIARQDDLLASRSFLSLINHPKFVRDRNRASYQNNRTLPNTRFINYMSFGLDAAIALEFHDRRKRDPNKFSSPLKNKLMYLNESRKYLNDFARSKLWNLSSYIRLVCDGDDLTDSIRNCHTLLVLNIPGYASGTNPWGKTSNNASASSQTIIIQKDYDSYQEISTSSIEIIDLPANTHEVYELVTLNDCPNDQINLPTITTVPNPNGRFDRQDIDDKKIEVVGLSTTHMATIHMGFRGIRIAQCSNLRIEICCPMTAQMDGEPFYLPESVAVNITHAGQVLVSKNESR
ncbi:unnamed protein product [Rotaria magnacalcarata]|uniref:Diacylglycerol kinase n=2 Tax=Rotaria magnacalcarata TaxID=392030 RepID=A0A814NPP8_9BILA|nr:unnamed protein product [Rotaria magnacalcarata]CAF1923073.1 unnamed protein product [Rotaria magnacalcarata]CAF3981268.1 unnamed protein product [Rotaria magnacalcarata]